MLINDANFKMIIDLVYTKEYEKTALNLSEKKTLFMSTKITDYTYWFSLTPSGLQTPTPWITYINRWFIVII